jgi:hypothetical protein
VYSGRAEKFGTRVRVEYEAQDCDECSNCTRTCEQPKFNKDFCFSMFQTVGMLALNTARFVARRLQIQQYTHP